MSSLVYQITINPKRRIELSEVSALDKPEVPPNVDGKDTKASLKEAYKRWLDNDVSCLGGADSTSCTQTADRSGFGYSHHTHKGVTSIYYFPTRSDLEDFSSSRPACADIEKKAGFPSFW